MADTEQKAYGYNWWINQLDQDEKRLRDEWWVKADKVVKKYKAKKDTTDDLTYLYNVFWANVGVLKAALYARPPRPMVSRVWADSNDNVARVSAEILQRCLAYDFMKNNSPMDEAIKLAVEDRLIPGLGLCWMRYDVETEEVSVPSAEGQEPVTFEVITKEEADCDYVHWRDVRWPAARVWSEVWYVGRLIYMTRSKFKDKFGVDVGKEDRSTPEDRDKVLPKNFTKDKISVYELWCRKTNKIYWVSRDVPGFCREKPDFLMLDGFYPCPQFLLATHTTDDYLPRSDYTMVQDQYDQLNELNTRITILEKALRVVGVYDKKNAEVARVLSEARENDMIPVDRWAVLAEAGGMKGVVDWFPIDVIAAVLDKLKEQKVAKIQDIYELTGISDIMRGTTNARETLGAQELKAQYSSVRLQYLQMDVSIFVRQLLIIKADIICRHFQDETILRLSNIEATPDAQYAQAAIQLLRDSEITKYKIDINEEGLALPDYNQEKQVRIEFLTTVGQFLSQAYPIAQVVPGSLPYLVQMIRWVASGMRGSEEIQGVLDQAIQQLFANPQSMQQPQQGEQKPNDGPYKVQQEQIKQQGETQRAISEAQARQMENKQKADLDLRNSLTIEKTKADNSAALENIKHHNQLQQAVQQAMHAAEATAHEIAAEDAQTESQREHEIRMQRMQPRPKKGE